ncbi:MAG: hypothetical protein QXE79_04020, partial [Candidatus Bathyarchaeia archaeon]
EAILQEALRIVDAADEKGLVLRVMGAIAIRIHCGEFSRLLKSLQRDITDIDLIGYGKQTKDVLCLLEELGYSSDRRMRMVAAVLQRYVFQSPGTNLKVDIFFDRLEMCHTIDFKGRLELDYPTITLSDLLLEKTQIVKINEKDIKDAIVLLREHEVGEAGKESIDREYISSLLSKDWGFYYTATTNLKKIQSFLPQFDCLSLEDRIDVENKIHKLREAIEAKEKSLAWKIRAKTGTKKRWYREVEDTEL